LAEAGPRQHRLRTFYLQEQEIITFERVQVSEAGSELIYTRPVLTPMGEAEGELPVRLPSLASPREGVLLGAGTITLAQAPGTRLSFRVCCYGRR
jgi:hypothetical protein